MLEIANDLQSAQGQYGHEHWHLWGNESWLGLEQLQHGIQRRAQEGPPHVVHHTRSENRHFFTFPDGFLHLRLAHWRFHLLLLLLRIGWGTNREHVGLQTDNTCQRQSHNDKSITTNLQKRIHHT